MNLTLIKSFKLLISQVTNIFLKLNLQRPTNLLLNEKVICNNLRWAKISVDKNTKVPSITLQTATDKLPIVISLHKKLTRQINGQ